MNVGDTLFACADAGLTLETSRTKDVLKVRPVENLEERPELRAAIKKHKPAIIRILREDEEYRRTGVIQAACQVFPLARDYFETNGKEEETHD